MPAPEHRTRWDVAAAVLLAVAVLVAGAALWRTSDAHRTLLSPAPAAGERPPQQRLVAPLEELWRAPSPATPAPLVRDGTAVTAVAGEVAGRDLVSGQIRWRYQRHLGLCTVGAAFGQVMALYQRGRWCSEVTALDWADGTRGPQRNGPVGAPAHLVGQDGQAAVVGHRYLEVWRSDLVRTLAYGRLPTPAQPRTQPRPDCAHGSLALHSDRGDPSRVAVVERCPSEETARLTVQPSRPEEAQEPEVDSSVLLPSEQAVVVALEPERVAVAVPDPARLLVFDGAGQQVAEHPLDVPEADLWSDPADGVAVTTRTPIGLSWFTGSATVALNAHDLTPRWTRPGTLGSGAVVDGRLLLPTPGALTAVNLATGGDAGRFAVDRGSYSGPVGTAGSGGVILEQRGDTLVALR